MLTNSDSRLNTQDSRLVGGLAVGSVIALVWSALAFGSVEAWAMAVLEAIAVVLVAMWIIRSVLDHQIRVAVPPVLLPVVGLVCWGLIQSIAITGASGERKSISMDAEASRTAVISTFFLLVLALTAANFISGNQRLRRVAIFLCFYGLAVSVFALIQSFTWDGHFYWFRPTKVAGFGPFANHDHFAGYMEMLAPFPVALIVTRAVPSEQKLVYGFAAVMMALATVASLSRGGMLSLAVEAVFITAWTWRSRSKAQAHTFAHAPVRAFPMRALLRAATVIVVFSVVAALGIAWIGADPIISKAAQTLNDFHQDPSGHISRQWIWSDTWSMIKAHPITGAGIGAYETVYPIYSHNNGRMIVAQSHNDYLQVLADCGVVGAGLMVAFVAVLYRATRRALKVRDRQLKGVALACSAGIIGILVHSFVDFNLQIPSNALLFLFLSVVVSNVGSLEC